MADVEEITDEEKLKIAQHLLISSPAGQVKEVLTDLKKLVPAGILTEPVIAGILRQYNTESYLPVAVTGSDTRLVISKATELDPTHYIDSRTKKIYQFDHLRQRLVVDDGQPVTTQMDSAHETLRVAVEDALVEYVHLAYGEKAGLSVLARQDQLQILISGVSVNLRNYWSGNWSSDWSVDISRRALSGQIRLHVHYFEDGNVQLHTSRKLSSPLSVQSTDVKAFAKAVCDNIKMAEDELQMKLGEMYENMNKETFKEMRRVMPITQMKMEWNLNAHRMVRNIRK